MFENFKFMTACFIFFILISCGQKNQDADTSSRSSEEFETHGQSGVVDKESRKNILQIAISSPNHKTLVAAVKAAELQDVLVNAGPLTVFAPTDEAFAALPEGTVEELLKPENISKLAKLITFHASPGKYMGDLLKDGMKLYQATGHYVDVVKKDGETYVNGAKILGTVEASNGVVHVVDKVFLLHE